MDLVRTQTCADRELPENHDVDAYAHPHHCRESLSINGSNVTQAQAYKTQTEDREASTSTVTRKVSTPSARKTRTHDAHGKGCCTIA